MVPYPAGGVSDVIARTLNVTLFKHLGQPVIVENLGGAGGAIAAQKVLNAPADGHIIFQGGPNELILAPLSNSAVKYKSEEFRLVQMITINPMAVLARKDLPVNNGDELIAYAKKAADAGTPIIFMTPFGKSHGQLVEEGKLKVVGVLSSERQAMFKKAPTLNESKALKGFVFEMWSGYFVRKDTPEAVVQALHKALSEVANDPAVRAALDAQAMVVPRPQPLTAMHKVYGDNITRYRAIAKAINLQPE